MIESQPAHPWIAEWIKVLIAAVVGFASSVIVDILKTKKQRKDLIQDMRVALYHEIGSLYSYVFYTLDDNLSQPDLHESVADNIRLLSTSTFEWAKTQPNVFYKLNEAQYVDYIYSYFAHIKSHINTDGIEGITIEASSDFISLVESLIAEGDIFDNELFNKELPKTYRLIVDNAEKPKQKADATVP
jgi:hypothetical protein